MAEQQTERLAANPLKRLICVALGHLRPDEVARFGDPLGRWECVRCGRAHDGHLERPDRSPVRPLSDLAAAPRVRPLAELRSSGLLWLINTTVFHPRGYAFVLHLDADGQVEGWSLHGDGSEPWVFEDGANQAEFEAVNALMPPPDRWGESAGE